MKRPGYNPTRRNRKIGTESSGFGQDNRLVIPWAWADDRIYYNRLVEPVDVEIKVRSVTTRVIVEPPLEGFIHACTIDDISKFLQMMPIRHFEHIAAFVLRQPKRKERILAPVWGRLVYWTDICGHSGPTVYLEAQDVNQPQKWSKSLSPDYNLELERLRRDGHKIETDKRRHLIHSTVDSVRNTQLYRTLPHEIGHYVDYLTKVEEPSKNEQATWTELNEKYHSRPAQEREAFAHRYADQLWKQLSSDGSIPFERILDSRKIKKMGLNPDWFDPNAL